MCGKKLEERVIMKSEESLEKWNLIRLISRTSLAPSELGKKEKPPVNTSKTPVRKMNRIPLVLRASAREDNPSATAHEASANEKEAAHRCAKRVLS